MSVLKTERCPACQAVVNPAWETCVACHQPLTTDEILIEPAAVNARPIYWERADLTIAGPAQPEFLARVGTGPRASYWVIAQFEGSPLWINTVVLRSRQAFEHQERVTVLEQPNPHRSTENTTPERRKQNEETTPHLFPTHGNTYL